jgi:hypothetical protein
MDNVKRGLVDIVWSGIGWILKTGRLRVRDPMR